MSIVVSRHRSHCEAPGLCGDEARHLDGHGLTRHACRAVVMLELLVHQTLTWLKQVKPGLGAKHMHSEANRHR